jgi:hypothetical protein
VRIQTKKSLIIKKIILWTIGAITFSIVVFSAYQLFNPQLNPIPMSLRKQLTFSPFVIPSSTKGYSTSSYRFNIAENSVQVLSYKIGLPSHTVTISEYTQPAQFTEIPDFKTTFLSNAIKQYATVQTSNGVIYLGRLSKQNNAQVGVMLERGLVVFLLPDSDIEQSGWRELGDQFEIQKSAT